MGYGWRPKSDAGVRPPERPESGVEAFEEYGQGDRDPLTGLYESYAPPPGRLAPSVEPPAWPDLWEQWPLIEWDFAHHLHLDVEELIRRKSFRWFAIRLMGLLGKQGTNLHAFFRRDETDSEPPLEAP